MDSAMGHNEWFVGHPVMFEGRHRTCKYRQPPPLQTFRRYSDGIRCTHCGDTSEVILSGRKLEIEYPNDFQITNQICISATSPFLGRVDDSGYLRVLLADTIETIEKNLASAPKVVRDLWPWFRTALKDAQPADLQDIAEKSRQPIKVVKAAWKVVEEHFNTVLLAP